MIWMIQHTRIRQEQHTNTLEVNYNIVTIIYDYKYLSVLRSLFKMISFSNLRQASTILEQM